MMNEKRRLKEVKSYRILDTPPDQGLDEFTEIASLMCDAPVALITILDESRQWFKAKMGVDLSEIRREDSFCQHVLDERVEMMVVNDSLLDARFQDNPFVKGEPYVRFYAGVPLATSTGIVLGSLCVLDNKPREISQNQKQALCLLARKVMDFLNSRKILLEQQSRIENNASKLRKMTDSVPAGIFQLNRKRNGKMHFDFLSKGMKELHPSINMESWKLSPEIGFTVIHPEDLEMFQASLLESFNELTDLDVEYRAQGTKDYHWHLVKARPERLPDNSVVWYGSFQDVTHRKEYEMAMEQIAFDISHILRGPITSLLALINSIENESTIGREQVDEYMGYIKSVSMELEQFTRDLNEIYQSKRKA